ncbi:ferrous iron transport protein B [Candidatus Hydrogenedentota bacterium]
MSSKRITVAVAGNPNCGKTSIFNNLTGAKQHVGNYPGVTVEKREGTINRDGYEVVFVDLPGTYSLSPYSLEEVVVRDFIVHERPDVVLNVVDASNLERNLYLTAQLIDLHCPLVLSLNMLDVAHTNRTIVNQDLLGELMGAPVVATNGRQNKGTNNLIETVIRVAENRDSVSRHIHVNYGAEVEQEVEKLKGLVASDSGLAGKYYPRWMSVKLIENDEEVVTHVREEAADSAGILAAARKSREHIESIYGEDSETIVTDRLYSFLNGLCRETVDDSQRIKISLSDKIDRVLTNRMLGLPIFAVLMWVVFQTTFTLAETPMGWIEAFIRLIGDVVGGNVADGIFKDLLIGGILDGVGGVIIFLPSILILFFFLALLDDTGYMARAAFLMDKIMHALGLHGKSFIALLTGIGCNAPAVMATRTLENREDRLVTILITPLVSCAARYPVYILFCGAFFANHQGTVILGLYALGAGLAVLMGLLFRKTLFKGKSSPFVMELPPYRIPTLRSVLIHMWDKAYIFVRKAGTIILAGVVVVWVFNTFPRGVSYSKDFDAEIVAVEKDFSERIKKLDGAFEKSMQKKSVAYADAFPPFEDSCVYKEIKDYYDAKHAELEGEQEKLVAAIENEKLSEEVLSRYAGRIGASVEPLIKPLGFDWRLGISMIPGFIAKEVVVGSLGVLFGAGETDDAEDATLREKLRSSYTPLQGFAFMVFTLLYIPCLATLAVIKRETGSWKWAMFSVVYSVTLAYIVTFIVFQGGLILGIGTRGM